MSHKKLKLNILCQFTSRTRIKNDLTKIVGKLLIDNSVKCSGKKTLVFKGKTSAAEGLNNLYLCETFGKTSAEAVKNHSQKIKKLNKSIWDWSRYW